MPFHSSLDVQPASSVFADTQVFVDPRDQGATQRHAKVGGLGRGEGALLGHHHAVNFQDGTLGVIQQGL
jgi:hypothetical protein